MKLAILSDLHANRQATEAVWEHATQQGCERTVLLGDYVDYGADPVWVLDFVQQRVQEGAIALKGNHDDAIRHEGSHNMGEHVQESLVWTRQQLSSAHVAFIESLPLVAELDDCHFAHANLHAPSQWGYLDGRMEAVRSMQVSAHPFAFCGHMHQPCLYHLSAAGKSGEFSPVDGTPIILSPMRRWLAIPGSVGQPRDGNPAACYAMFDTSSKQLTFHRVPYDHERAAQRIIDAGLPMFLAQRLRDGR
ncbi:metallophosphoesterase family protein [Aquabacterium sp.]|uniref:metallophosphoesterase family protein n=1 Tax=Aquabacterium sp. TaxID=1872578 RepID=UPI004038330B